MASSGRYNNACAVLRDALRLMEERDAKLQALWATLDEEETALSQEGY